MKISVCIPVYNGAKTIESLVNTVCKELKGYNLEIVLVNDGSVDNCEEICEMIAKEKEFIKFISLRRNFGEHNAVMCALNYTTGDLIAIIDDDFQNPPSEIVKLITEAEKGYDVVYSKYHRKKYNWYRNLGSKINDLVATWLLKKPKNLYLSSFKVINREIVKELIQYRGPFPYIDGLILRVTNNISSVFVEHRKSIYSKSGYTLSKLISLWLSMFVNFSIKPLRIFTFFGMFLSMISFFLAIFFIIEKLLKPNTPIGWTTIIVVILFFSGIQLIFLGVIGEYLGKLYLDINKTPQWVVKKEIL